MSKTGKVNFSDWLHRVTADGYSGIERDIVNMFLMMHFSNTVLSEPLLAMDKLDTVVTEMAFKFGRADIVVFHIDGTASVIEVKDGTKGYQHVVSGIGQAGLYACQLAMNKGTLRKVRKCLMWSSTGNILLDGVIEETCEQSGTIPLPMGKLSVHLAALRTANQNEVVNHESKVC